MPSFRYFWGGLNAFLPAFLLANLTFQLSMFTRSANTADMRPLNPAQRRAMEYGLSESAVPPPC